MSVLHFAYKMEINYAQEASRCYFTIKCVPREDERQRLLGLKIALSPGVDYACGQDSFGNQQIYGCVLQAHQRFVYQAEGEVEILQTDYVEEARPEQRGLFLTAHGKCVPDEGLRQYYQAIKADLSPGQSRLAVCEAIMHRLHGDFVYQPGETQVQTTAGEAWRLGKGVCQDYAHIYITLLRLAGIPARYVCGLITGEGASHAWVEAECGGRWAAFDPTHDCRVWDNYIKLGHGRDAADCAINRGLIWNGGEQQQKISVTVDKI